MKGLFSLLGNFSAIKDEAPALLGGFLDQLLEDNKKNLQPENGEAQIFFVMYPVQGSHKHEYYISIVAADENDTVKREIKTILLKDALNVIFNSIGNAD